MAKRSFEISSLNAFRIVAVLKTAKPRRKALRKTITPMHDNLIESLLDDDPEETIREAVVEAILQIAGKQPPVSDAQTLSGLGYIEPMYAQLAAEMTTIVQAFKPSATILPSEVKKSATVGGCVSLAVKKAGV